MNEDYMFEDEDKKDSGNNSYGNPQYNYGEYKGPQYSYAGGRPIESEDSVAMAVVSMILGVISLTLFLAGVNFISAIIAIILGIIFLCKRHSKGNAFAITGIVTAALSMALCIAAWSFIYNNADRIISLQNDGDLRQWYQYYYGTDNIDEIFGENPTDELPFDDDFDIDDTL